MKNSLELKLNFELSANQIEKLAEEVRLGSNGKVTLELCGDDVFVLSSHQENLLDPARKFAERYVKENYVFKLV